MYDVRKRLLTTTAIVFAAPLWAQATSVPAGQTAAQNPATSAAATSSPAGGADDIVVTATRQSQSLSKVAISVSAFTGAKLETLGVKSFADIQRYTPGVQFDPDRKDIAIRGVSSDAGTGTTGIYIDDTPIQARALGLNANNTLPIVFDLERVEVLRGPQGTLFGAGSEGGTVRYITPQPSLKEYTGYGRVEGLFTENGSPGYEAGVALGGPIVADKLGFRGSAWFRRDGGYINRVDDQTGATTQRDANWVGTMALRGALAWRPVDNVTVTPAIFYQDRYQRQNNRYWIGISDPRRGRLFNGTPDRQSDTDRFLLPSLKIQADIGKVSIISNTSYYNRKELVNGYSGTLYNYSLLQQLLGTSVGGAVGDPVFNFNLDPADGATGVNPTTIAAQTNGPLLTATGINNPFLPNYQARVFVTNRQENITQELRAQSNDPGGRFQWVVGAFFQSNHQTSIEEINDPQLPTLIPLLFGTDFLTFTEGVPLLANGDSYINNSVGKDRQFALFADGTFALTERLKVTAGVRYAWTKFSFTNFADGPQNVGFSTGTGAKSEQPFTPKVGVSFQADPNNLFYATVSKGFRIGGANIPFPLAICQADIDKLGGKIPTTYNSDTVWSYEIGSKNKLFDRRLTFAGSAYYLVWSGIQQANYLTSCGFQYIGNLGTVHSKGFDAQLNLTVMDGLNLDLAVGYTDARYSKTTLSAGPGSNPLSTVGNTIPGYSPWTVTVGAQYDFRFGQNAAFIRGDYEYKSRNPYLTTGQDPRNAVNDPALVNNPAYAELNIRAGLTVRKVQLEAFVNNLADSRPRLELTHQDQYTELFEAQTIRPRSYGVAASYRF